MVQMSDCGVGRVGPVLLKSPFNQFSLTIITNCTSLGASFHNERVGDTRENEQANDKATTLVPCARCFSRYALGPKYPGSRGSFSKNLG